MFCGGLMRIKINDKYHAMQLRSKFQDIKEEIVLSATLNIVYFHKKSEKAIQVKMNHQLNAMETTIHQINPKFQEKSKKYDKIKQEMMETLDSYEKVLKQLANQYDEKMQQMILKKLALEFELLTEIVRKNLQSEEETKKEKSIFELEKQIKKMSQKIRNLDTEKNNKIFEAMEVGGKELTSDLKKTRKIKKITTFFSNRFYTDQVILKSLILPMRQRIDEFQVNELKKVVEKVKEFNLVMVQDSIKSVQNKILENPKNQAVFQKIGIRKKQ